MGSSVPQQQDEAYHKGRRMQLLAAQGPRPRFWGEQNATTWPNKRRSDAARCNVPHLQVLGPNQSVKRRQRTSLTSEQAQAPPLTPRHNTCSIPSAHPLSEIFAIFLRPHKLQQVLESTLTHTRMRLYCVWVQTTVASQDVHLLPNVVHIL